MMRSRILAIPLLLAACGDRSPPPSATPITDVVRIPAGEFIGQVSTCVQRRAAESTVLSEPDADGDVRQRVEAFEIERLPVSCIDWRQCKRAGVCKERTACVESERFAIVEFAEATRLCESRGGRLASLPELQRAMRGTQGPHYSPGWDAEKRTTVCTEPSQLSHTRLARASCEQTSPDGLIYFTEAYPEWTSTINCPSAEDDPRHGRDDQEPPRALWSSGAGYLSAAHTSREAYAFVRCARTAPGSDR